MSLLSPNLLAFIATTEHSTLASAARALRITQSAVTLRIQSLEKDLGVDLFIRSRRGMSLTPSGEALLNYCKRSIELESETMPNITGSLDSLGSTKWTIQSPSSPMRTRILEKIPLFRASFPNVALELRVSDLDSGIESLKSGATDLLITEQKYVSKEFDSKMLRPERYILVGPSAWNKRELKEILANERIIDFNPSDDMTQRFLEKHHFFNLAHGQRFFVNSTDYIENLIERGVGYSVLSEEMALAGIKSKRLINLFPEKFFDFKIALAWYPRKQMSKSLQGFIRTIS